MMRTPLTQSSVFVSALALAVLFSACTTARPSTPGSGNAAGCDVLDYEPVPVVLRGRIGFETFYGPPGYGEDPARDFMEIVPVLVLDRRISTRGKKDDAINGGSFSCVEKVQIVHTGGLSPHLGKSVSIGGVLFQAHTGHHHTDVLINADTIEPPGDTAGAGRFSATMVALETGKIGIGGEMLRVLGWSAEGKIAYLRGKIPRGPIGGQDVECTIINLKNGEILYHQTMREAGDLNINAHNAGTAALRLDHAGIIPGEPRLEKLPVRFNTEKVTVSLTTRTFTDGSTGEVMAVTNLLTGAVAETVLGERESIVGLYRSPFGPWAAVRYHSSPGNTAAPENEFEEFDDIIILRLTGGEPLRP